MIRFVHATASWRQLDIRVARTACWVVLVVLAGGCQFVDSELAADREIPIPGLADKNSNPRKSTERGEQPPAVKAEDKAELKLVVARRLEKKDQVERAVQLYKEAIQADPTLTEALHRLAVLSDKQGRHDESLAWYQKALALEPTNAEIHCDVGYSFYLQQHWSEAEEALRRAVAIDEGLARARNNLGLLLTRTGRHDEALHHFRQTGATEAECRSNLAHGLLLVDRWQEARRQCEIALQLDGVTPQAQRRLRQLLELAMEGSARPEQPTAENVSGQQHESPIDVVQMDVNEQR